MQENQKQYHILVVEDNPGDYLLVEDYLLEEMRAPHIHKAECFKDARVLLQEMHSEMDVVLLDLTLPDKKGEELINETVAVAHDIPVIILTGYTDVKFAVKALSLGACDYVLKDSLNPTVLYKSIMYNIERNKTLVRLRESEQRYSDLFHLSPQPMWVYDLESLYFVAVNEAAVKHYGYSSDEFLQMTIRDIRPKEEVPLLEQRLVMLQNKDQHYSQGEFRHQKKNGEEIIVDIRSNIVQYKGRRAELVLAADITDRYRHMKAIEEQNVRLREIAWTQSHVVRAPLARIMGLIQIMKFDNTSVKDKEQFLDYLMTSAEELDNTIKSIVDKAWQTPTKK